MADFVNGGGQNVFVRPNQVIACSLEYSPLSDEMIHGVLDVVKNELLTPKGLRTLAPKNPAYEGTYEGDQAMEFVLSGKFMTEILLILRMGVYRKPGVWGRF